MWDDATPGGAGFIFQNALNDAITRGLRPPPDSGLGFVTHGAVDEVARHHPEATVGSIADAYDAFAREHGPVAPRAAAVEPGADRKPRQGVARRKGSRVR